MRRTLLLWCGALCLTAGGALAQTANGLIVQLRDAPSHEALARERTLAADAPRVRHEDDRWQRVLGAAGVAARDQRPVGRAARLLGFGRRLGAAEAQALAQRLRERPEVAWVEPNVRERRLQALAPPADPFFAEQWWLHPVAGTDGSAIRYRLRGVPGFQAAWSQTTGPNAARVAVLDTGITAHPDLGAGFYPGYDFVADVASANDGNGRDNNPADPGDWVSQSDLSDPAFEGCTVEDSSWHGTLIAGQLAANTNNGVGVAATSWDGQVVPVRVAGKCGADVTDIIDGMRWAAGLAVPGAPANPWPARVINISFGGSAACGAAYQTAIDEVYAAGAVVVAAAGNEHGAPTRPASCERVVGVAAVNRDGFKTTYSNFGPQLKIATVGGDTSEGRWGDLFDDGGLLTLYNEGTRGPGSPAYAYLYGTSFAAPVVAGALSLMLTVNPALSADQLLAGLAASARPHVTSALIGPCSADNPGRCLCTTATCGAGLLDVVQALRYAQAPQSYVAPAWTAAVLDNPELRTAAARGPDRGTAASPTPSPAPSGGGGGALHGGWVLGLLAAAALLLWRRAPGRPTGD